MPKEFKREFASIPESPIHFVQRGALRCSVSEQLCLPFEQLPLL